MSNADLAINELVCIGKIASSIEELLDLAIEEANKTMRPLTDYREYEDYAVESVMHITRVRWAIDGMIMVLQRV